MWKSNDTTYIRQVVSGKVETSNIDLIWKHVGPVLVLVVTIVTKKSLPSAILQKEPEDDLPEFEFETSSTSCETSQKRRLDVVTNQSLSSAILQKELEDDLPEFGTLTTSCQTWYGYIPTAEGYSNCVEFATILAYLCHINSLFIWKG